MPAPVLRTCLVALVIAPLILLVASLLGTASGDLSTSGWRGGFQLLAMAAFALGLFGGAVLIAAQAPRLAVVLLVLGALGAAGGAGFGVDFIHAEAFGERLPNPTRSLVAGDGMVGGFVAGFILVGVAGFFFPLALMLLAVGLWRVRLVPPALAALVAVGGALFPLGRIPDAPALVVAADLVLVVALGLAAARLLGAERRLASGASQPA